MGTRGKEGLEMRLQSGLEGLKEATCGEVVESGRGAVGRGLDSLEGLVGHMKLYHFHIVFLFFFF